MKKNCIFGQRQTNPFIVSTTSPYDQKVLFRRVSAGEVDAFRVLFDLYRNRLYAAALKLTKDRAAAEDIVQEVFTALWEGRENLATVDNPPAYIFTVAYNKTYRYLKRVAADGRLYQALRLRMKTAYQTTEELLDLKETQQLIEHVVEKLPSQRRLIYRLSREKGLTHQQIADRLHISPLTAKKQIVLALRHIRSSLARMAPFLTWLFLWDSLIQSSFFFS